MKKMVTLLLVLCVMLLAGCEQSPEDGMEAYVVTFDTGISLVSTGKVPTIDTTITVYTGEELEALPAPAWQDEEYTFRGWYDKPEGGSKIETPFKPSSDITLYAYWGNGTTENDDYNITFDAGDGSFSDGSATLTKYIRRPPWTIIDMPVATKSSGEIFGGWKTPNGTPLTVTTVVAGIEEEQRNASSQWLPPGSEFTVTFTTYGGKWADGTNADKEFNVGDDGKGVITIAEIPPVPSLTGFVSTGWHYTDGTQTLPFSEGIFITGNFLVYPVWDIGDDFTVPESVTFAVNDGKSGFVGTDSNGVMYSTTITDGTTFSTLENGSGKNVVNFAITDVSRVVLHRMAGKYFSSQDWAMEMYIKIGSRGTNKFLLNFYGPNGQAQPGSFWVEDSSAAGNRLLLRAFPRGTEQLLSNEIVPNPPVWMHIAWVKKGGMLSSYRNGVKHDSSGTNDFAVFTSNVNFNNMNVCRVGNLANLQMYEFTLRNYAPVLEGDDFANKADIQAIVDSLNGN